MLLFTYFYFYLVMHQDRAEPPPCSSLYINQAIRSSLDLAYYIRSIGYCIRNRFTHRSGSPMARKRLPCAPCYFLHDICALLAAWSQDNLCDLRLPSYPHSLRHAGQAASSYLSGRPYCAARKGSSSSGVRSGSFHT